METRGMDGWQRQEESSLYTDTNRRKGLRYRQFYVGSSMRDLQALLGLNAACLGALTLNPTTNEKVVTVPHQLPTQAVL